MEGSVMQMVIACYIFIVQSICDCMWLTHELFFVFSAHRCADAHYEWSEQWAILWSNEAFCTRLVTGNLAIVLSNFVSFNKNEIVLLGSHNIYEAEQHVTDMACLLKVCMKDQRRFCFCSVSRDLYLGLQNKHTHDLFCVEARADF